MVGRAFSVKINLDLHAVTCPGVWLCPDGKVALQIHIFNSSTATDKLTPIFPLLYHNKFTFKQVFAGITTLAELEKKLAEEYIFAELIQCSSTANRNISLAKFQSNLVDLLYPVPCFKGLLAGVDVDLLMEPSKFFPGILAPKIEVSTRTTIEECTNFDIRSSAHHIINPKIINSTNQHCIYKKKDSLTTQRTLRQKRVCHTNHEKLDTYMCRLCRRQGTNGHINLQNNIHTDYQLHPSSKGPCYLSTVPKKQLCSCTSTVQQKSSQNYSICNDAHILDSCPICLKYKCYFSNGKMNSSCYSKLYDVANSQIPCHKCVKGTSKIFSGINYETKNSSKNVQKLSNDIESLNLQSNLKNINFKTYDGDSCKSSSFENCKNSSIYRSNSAPSLQEDQTTSILLAKLKQLEKTKERLSNTHCNSRYSEQALLCKDVQNNEARKGFYKNLEKFYKRMYKQAKQRAGDLGKT